MSEISKPKKRRRLTSWIVAALALYLVGFAFFALTLPAGQPDNTERADAIVALTGEGARLQAAVDLLERGAAKRLLITGVNTKTTKEQLKILVHGASQFDCCTDLGFTAEDTRGNASEAAQWVRARNYKSLIVVTANYHMPRAMIEFGAAMPDVKLIAYPVATSVPRSPLRLFSRLQIEYAKYLASAGRYFFEHIL